MQGGDAGQGKGETQKFLAVEVHSPSYVGNGCWERLGIKVQDFGWIKARRRGDTDVGSTMEYLLCY